MNAGQVFDDAARGHRDVYEAHRAGLAAVVVAVAAETRRECAAEIASSFPLNGELRYDGTADPLASAYVEGLHDAYSICLEVSPEVSNT